MKITAVDTAILRIPTRKPIALDFPYHSLVVAHVRTDEGVTGLGYTLAFGGGGVESIQAYLATRLAPLLMGQDPLLVERLWERMYRADRGIKRQGIAAYALSALDIALWDIVGKAAGLPLYKLWGAVTDRVAAYGSGGWPSYSLDDLIGEAQAYVARGCRYYKMKIHNPDPRANREPVLADDLAACAEVARGINIPVATGENNYTRFEFRDLIERGAARYLMPDLCRANGFSETLKIGRLAAAHQLAVSPHVVHELSLQVAGALSNGFLVEWIDWVPEDLFAEMPVMQGGDFLIPDRPGHGMTLAPGAEKKYRVG